MLRHELSQAFVRPVPTRLNRAHALMCHRCLKASVTRVNGVPDLFLAMLGFV